jgi:CheY-like chemotaxis protein
MGSRSDVTGAEVILVVEDDDELRDYSTEILGELGYTVLRAANAAEARRLLETHRVDLLFTDIVMPGGMNGRELAEQATQRWPALKVLFTTGYTRNAIIHHGRLDAGVHLISKPYLLTTSARKFAKYWTDRVEPRLHQVIVR